VEKNLLIQKLNKALGKDVLEMSRFGKSDIPLVWVAAPTLLKVVKFLVEDPDLQLNWLENLSVVELDEVFMVSYFIRSFSTPFQIILRVSHEIKERKNDKVKQIISLNSVRRYWPMAEPIEDEIEELFGFQFNGENFTQKPISENQRKILFLELQGFPLRKNFQFPQMVQEIVHHRNPGVNSPIPSTDLSADKSEGEL
jgi:NADH:ubiquinone oxidoreductase subunit C